MGTSRMATASSKLTVMCTAPAKVNLCLRVTGRRTDGYHLLDSVFAAIDFHDRLTIETTPARTHAERQIVVSCSYPGVPNDSTNLAARAADTLLAECGVGAEIAITIDKRIPPGSGLGGGSSNAGSVLRHLNVLLSLGVTERRLAELALTLGADVPFFLTGGCARVQGIGERIEPIRGWPGLQLILALPPVAVSTAWAFRAYSQGCGFDQDATEPARLATAADLDPGLLWNDLEAVVLPAYPEIARVKRDLLAAGASAAVMSGSGAAVVGLVPEPLAAAAIVAAFAALQPGVPVHCVRVLGKEGSRSVDPAPGYA
jgi:4-diphosphocytidyl-2-C-methyl-D-erythritol kinase